jgi:hypothetical protein
MLPPVRLRIEPVAHRHRTGLAAATEALHARRRIATVESVERAASLARRRIARLELAASLARRQIARLETAA